jgi:hypothetical protein
VKVWWKLYRLILSDTDVKTRLSSRLEASQDFYAKWGDVLGRKYKQWWKETGSGLFVQKDTVQRFTPNNVKSVNLDDSHTFAVAVAVGATPSTVARTFKYMYRRHYDRVFGAPVGKKRWKRRGTVYALGENQRVRIPVYVVRMQWFRDVGKQSFLGTLKGKDLMNATQDWFDKNAEWVKEQSYPMEKWVKPTTGQDFAKQRTMTFRVDKFMKDALTHVADGVFP